LGLTPNSSTCSEHLGWIHEEVTNLFSGAQHDDLRCS
jgi:hypothetical protein